MKDSNAITNLILASVAEGIYGIDLEGHVTFINQAALTLLGYTEAELLHHPIRELVEVDEDSALTSIKECAYPMGEQAVVVNHAYYQRKDKSTFPVSYSCAPIQHGEAIIGAVIVFRDITERIQLEEETRKNTELLKAIINHANSMIYLKDLEGRYLLANQHILALFGVSEKNVLGKTDTELLPKNYAEQYRQADKKVLDSKKQVTLEEDVLLNDGIHHFASVRFPLFTKDGSIYAIAGVATDITERVKQEKALRESLESIEQINRELKAARQAADAANESKSTFLANMSHDIRTPLNGIIGTASLLEQTDLSAKQLQYVNRIMLSGKILLALLNDILDLSKIEAGKITLERIPSDLKELLHELIGLFGQKADEKGISLSVSIAPDVHTNTLTDPLRLRQILTNLLANAIKFTHQGSIQIRLKATATNHTIQRVRFEVLDSGIGIPTTALPLLFHKFQQADASTTRKYGGTGLGLAICKQLIDLFEGTIGCESQEGQGSLFWFEIPLQHEPVLSSQ